VVGVYCTLSCGPRERNMTHNIGDNEITKHQIISSEIHEEECDEDDDTEEKKEGVPLLQNQERSSFSPVEIIVSDKYDKDLDILAASTSSLNTMESGRVSSLQAMCGHKPAKLTALCLVVLTIWSMVVLIIHLDRKVSEVGISVEITQEKLRTLKESDSIYRRRTQTMLDKMHRELGRLSPSLDTDSSTEIESQTKPSDSSVEVTIPTTKLFTLPSAHKPSETETEDSTETEDPFFSGSKNDWDW